MTSYKDSGVDIDAGNAASKAAYTHAIKTFASRKGMIGAPLEDAGGFAGLLDMGDYYLVQNDDGTGSKMDLAFAMQKYDTIGYDLLAMVADDAICMGAEVISVSNTMDVSKVDPTMVDAILSGLSKACQEQKIVIPGGEIAEVPGAVNSPVWNATAIGIVAKDRVLNPETISEGDNILALRSGVVRSNGFSLVRKILSDNFGKDWHKESWKDGKTWGDIMLTPSIIYHSAMLKILGRYGEDRAIEIKGVTHITGGGIAENLRRTLKKSGYGAQLTDLWEPNNAIKDLIEIGSVEMEEAYRTWNMGNGMLVILAKEDSDRAIEMLGKEDIEAKICGTITKDPKILLNTYTEESIVI